MSNFQYHLNAAPLAVGSPQFGEGLMTAAPLSISPPVLGAPPLAQVHTLSALQRQPEPQKERPQEPHRERSKPQQARARMLIDRLWPGGVPRQVPNRELFKLFKREWRNDAVLRNWPFPSESTILRAAGRKK